MTLKILLSDARGWHEKREEIIKRIQKYDYIII